MADGSDLTRWNVARSLAGDILAAVAEEDRRGEDNEKNEDADAYEYTDLLNDHPDRQLPSEEALRTGIGIVLCAVDDRNLDFSMDSSADPTTRSQGAELAEVDDRERPTDDSEETDTDGPASVWSRAVNLTARWLMSNRSGIRVGGELRHRLNSWNEARHLASQFVRAEKGEMDYEETTGEWPQVEFPPEETVLTIVRNAASDSQNEQECIDEVARWTKSLNWLERDSRDTNRVAMGESGDGNGMVETPSMVLKQTNQLTLSGDVQPNSPSGLGHGTDHGTGVEKTKQNAEIEHWEDDSGEDGTGSDTDTGETPTRPVQSALDSQNEDSQMNENEREDSTEDDDGMDVYPEAAVTDSAGENRTLPGCVESGEADSE